jgi:hypothetical protein
MAALAGELERIETSPVGLRHHNLFAGGCAVGELIAGGELDRAAEAELLEKAQTIGLPASDAERQVRRGLERGRRRPRVAPPHAPSLTNATEARMAVVAWWADVESREWNGRAGSTSLRILAGWRDLMLKAGRVQATASYRQVAGAAGVSLSTVVNRKADWLPFVALVKKGNRLTGAASVWKLKRARANRSHTPIGTASDLFVGARPSCNVWHDRAAAWRLWLLLSVDEGEMAPQLARSVGVHPSTARRNLHRLLALGLVQQDADGLWTRTALDPPALDRDGIDHAAERKERHRAERELDRRRRSDRLTEKEREPVASQIASATPVHCLQAVAA